MVQSDSLVDPLRYHWRVCVCVCVNPSEMHSLFLYLFFLFPNVLSLSHTNAIQFFLG